MSNRAFDWLSQAIKDLEFAKKCRDGGNHEWACFIFQQAAEKAVRALHLYKGQQGWGHVVARLINDLPEEVEVEDKLVAKAKVLDNFYIPARYPDNHPEGAPFEHYGPLQSEEAIRYAGQIVEFVGSKMA